MNKKSDQSQKLKQTLQQLEMAIQEWEQIFTDPKPQESQVPPKALNLLKKLKTQIDELSE